MDAHPTERNREAITQSAAKPKRDRTFLAWGAVGLASGLLIGIIGTLVVQEIGVNSEEAQAEQRVEDAREGIVNALDTCGLRGHHAVEIPESRESATFTSAGLHGATVGQAECFGEKLGMPDHVASEMGQTRALDGRQEAEWDDYAVSWSYHPDSGLNVVYSVNIDD